MYAISTVTFYAGARLPSCKLKNPSSSISAKAALLPPLTASTYSILAYSFSLTTPSVLVLPKIAVNLWMQFLGFIGNLYSSSRYCEVGLQKTCHKVTSATPLTISISYVRWMRGRSEQTTSSLFGLTGAPNNPQFYKDSCGFLRLALGSLLRHPPIWKM